LLLQLGANLIDQRLVFRQLLALGVDLGVLNRYCQLADHLLKDDQIGFTVDVGCAAPGFDHSQHQPARENRRDRQGTQVGLERVPQARLLLQVGDVQQGARFPDVTSGGLFPRDQRATVQIDRDLALLVFGHHVQLPARRVIHVDPHAVER
jgi:hypothetical protein